MVSAYDKTKEYTVSVSTDNIHEAIASVASALYTLVEEALVLHEDHEAEECEFEQLARDILGVLTRHGEQLSGGDPTWEPPAEEDLLHD